MIGSLIRFKDFILFASLEVSNFMNIMLIAFVLTLSTTVIADTHVRGYYKQNGTYVAPHYRSSPNSTTTDNFSTKGNINPYTGQEGTHNPTDTGYVIDNETSNTSTYNYQGLDHSVTNQENKDWLNSSCPRALGPSLWKACIERV
jgi:hypothetical protein